MPRVTLLPADVAVDIGPGEAIVDGLRRAGWRTRYKCRRGGCGICRSRLLAGAVRYPEPVAESVLSAADRAAGLCLPCRAVPTSDVVVEQAERAVSPMLASVPVHP